MSRQSPESMQSAMRVLLREQRRPHAQTALFDAKALERDVQFRRNMMLYGMAALGFIILLSWL